MTNALAYLARSSATKEKKFNDVCSRTDGLLLPGPRHDGTSDDASTFKQRATSPPQSQSPEPTSATAAAFTTTAAAAATSVSAGSAAAQEHQLQL